MYYIVSKTRGDTIHKLPEKESVSVLFREFREAYVYIFDNSPMKGEKHNSMDALSIIGKKRKRYNNPLM